MDKEKNKDLWKLLADTIVERPHGFSVGNQHFFLYPATLGKLYAISKVSDQLCINKENIAINPFAEALRLVRGRRGDCALLLAYYTIRKPKEMFDSVLVNQRQDLLSKGLTDNEMATLMLIVLTSDHTAELSRYLKIDKELDRMRKVSKARDSKNTYSFGGVSVYGSLIGTACEKFHWTYDYVLWGISYTNLQLLLQDSIQQMILSDAERKKAHVSNDSERINADDPRNWDKIKDLKLY